MIQMMSHHRMMFIDHFVCLFDVVVFAALGVLIFHLF